MLKPFFHLSGLLTTYEASNLTSQSQNVSLCFLSQQLEALMKKRLDEGWIQTCSMLMCFSNA